MVRRVGEVVVVFLVVMEGLGDGSAICVVGDEGRERKGEVRGWGFGCVPSGLFWGIAFYWDEGRGKWE